MLHSGDSCLQQSHALFSNYSTLAHAGSRLRRDLTSEGGVAPLGGTTAEAINLSVQLGGLEEKFAFKRAISRLHEMQSAAYLLSRSRHE